MHTAQSPILTTHNLTVGYRKGKQSTAILSGLNLSVATGTVVALLGRNGAGKSTLLRAITGAEKPIDGRVVIGGRDTATMSSREMSRKVGLVSTERIAAGGLTVIELVELGRQPHTGFTGRLAASDREAVAKAIASVGMEHMADRYMAELSDGERQKVMIARAIAQETPLIVLDEPTAFLDVASRIRTMQMLHTLARTQGKAVLLSSHDVQQSLLLADALWVITDDGQLVSGTTEEVVMSGAMSRTFADASIEFSAAMCDYEAMLPTTHTVTLDCPDPMLRRCIANALMRNGIAISPDSTVKVKALSLYQFEVNGRKAGSIAELVSNING